MRLLLTILFAITAWLCHAQRYVFEQWGTDDGLPTSTVNDITEDPLGFIWLATDGAGLVRFDGTTFSQPIPSDSLPSPFVTVLEKDSLGNIWIGTENGPAYYDGNELNKLRGIPKELLTRINTIVPIGPNDVWFGTRNGLFHFNGAAFSNSFPEQQEVTSIHVESTDFMHNRLVYLTPKGLDGDFTFDSIFLSKTGKINRLLNAGDSLLFVGENGTFSGNKKLTTANDIRDALQIDGEYWLGSSSSGIQIVGAASSKHIINANSGLSFDRVRCLYKSTSGTIWIGSQSGLSKLASRHLNIYDQSQGLADERIHAIYEAKNGDIWTGSFRGVSCLRSNDTNLTNYTSANGFPAGVVLNITEDDEGTVWFATERGLVRKTDNGFTINPLADPFVFSVENHSGNLYVGTSSGLYIKQGNAFNIVNTQGNGFAQLVSTKNGLLGVSLAGGLYNINKEDVSQISAFGKLNLDTLQIHQVAPLQNGLAIAVNGLGIYICQDASCDFIRGTEDLKSLNIDAIATSKNRLWIGTERGLFSIQLDGNVPERNIQFFGEETGYLAKEGNERAMLVTTQNELLVGTNSGLYRIQQSEFAKQQLNTLFITSVDLFFNAQTNWKEKDIALNPWSSAPQKLMLPFDQNYLTFHFASPIFNGQELYVRYKLDGQDKEWTRTQDRMEAVFTDISPGSYTFIVQSASNPNFLNPAETSIPVSIIPPFYRTLWFWVLIGLALVTVAFFVVRFRINQLNARLALESALADSERKALRLQMNPHFVFNALDAISGFIFKNEPKEAVRYLTSFAKLMRLTLESSRETIVPLQNEIQLLKNYVALEQLRFGNNFDYEMIVEDDVDPYEVYLPPMLLQPFVENAILHGLRYLEGRRGKLTLNFSIDDESLLCTVSDNGVGRKVSAERNAKRGKTSLATSITEERIALLSKSLGRTVTFNIVDLADDEEKPLGTAVTISFPQLAGDDET